MNNYFDNSFIKSFVVNLLALSIITFSNSAIAFSKKKIVTSIPPVASLIKMVSGDLFELSIIQKKSSCPHHYSIKPSQIKTIKQADIIIIIDNQFETSIAKFTKQSSANKLILNNKLNQFKQRNNPKFDSLTKNNRNLHIWLGLDNAESILALVKDFLSQYIDSSEHKEILEKNYMNARKKIIDLKNKVDSNAKIVFLGHSLEYFRDDFNTKNLYFPKVKSLKKLNEVSRSIEEFQPNCIVYDDSVNEDLISRDFQKYGTVRIDIEQWDIESHLEDFYTDYILKFYDSIQKCM